MFSPKKLKMNKGCLPANPATAGLRAGLLAGLILLGGCAEQRQASVTRVSSQPNWSAHNRVWRGVHLWLDRESAAQELISTLPRLAAAGVNVVVIEVNYSFEFQAHPELRNRHFIRRATAQELAAAARRCGIRVSPEFNCLGHQSFSGRIAPLLKVHPGYNEMPSQSLTNKSIYCLEWCPQAPGLNEIVFSLIDEMAEAFGADAVHVGMDEVFLIASEHCPRCRGGDPAKLFAKAVNDLHQHIVNKRKCQMFMWADRLLDAKSMGYGEWESAQNGTAGAVDLIPKDIVLCDWHYELRTNYPSVPFLVGKGFRVWPAGWKSLPAAQALSEFSRRQQSKQVVGYLCTTWGAVKISDLAEWPPLVEVMKQWH